MGLLAGAALWAYTLLLPELARGGWFGTGWIEHGPFGIEAFRPQRLFGMSGWDALTHGVFWSLLINTGTFVFMSMRYRPRLQDQLLAAPFLDPYAQRDSLVAALGTVKTRTGAQVHVVFDGDAEGARPAVGAPLPVRVHFSPAEIEADDVILDMVAGLPTDVPVLVVSSDRRVADGARRLGANSVRSRELLDLVRR